MQYLQGVTDGDRKHTHLKGARDRKQTHIKGAGERRKEKGTFSNPTITHP